MFKVATFVLTVLYWTELLFKQEHDGILGIGLKFRQFMYAKPEDIKEDGSFRTPLVKYKNDLVSCPTCLSTNVALILLPIRSFKVFDFLFNVAATAQIVTFVFTFHNYVAQYFSSKRRSR